MRRRRRWLAVVVAATCFLPVGSVSTAVPVPGLAGAIFRDPSYPPAERAADLVSRMTLDEKASQMVSSQAPAIPRLGLRAYGWWNEAIHGVAREQLYDGENPPELVNTTSYPVSLSLGSTWNPDLVHQVAAAISDEAREVVRDNTLDLNFYSPTVNLARDPRWGRNDETYGEDPFLTAAIAAQYVNGMEGKDPSGALLPEGGGYLKTTTTLKHYAANNSEFNRRDGSSDMDERTLREYYTAQFRSIVRRSDPASIMTGYNRVNGVPATASVHLLEELGRQTFGFGGFYTSDCDSIYEIEHGHRWGPPGGRPVDAIDRHAVASAAGVDLNCQLGYHDEFNYANSLPQAVKRRSLTELGIYAESNLDAALVRLFTARIRLGEFDDPSRVPWVTQARSRVAAGTWVNSDYNGAITQTPARLALARQAASESLVLLRNEGGLLPLAVPASGGYRVAVVGPAARPAYMYLGGYSSSQGPAGRAKQVNAYDGIRAAVQAVNPAATVDYLPGLTALSASAINADVLTAIASYDVVIVGAGTDASAAAEDTDRADLALPDGQAELIRQVAARNPNTVVFLETVGQMDLAPLAEVGAVLWSSYNGQRKGEALADVLIGRTNPSGHLPFTWYRDLDQLPPLDDYRIRPHGQRPGRTYMYFTGAVSYPFGHGLSYTTFGYSDARLDQPATSPDGNIRISVDVTNTGPAAGAHVVQVYAATPDAAAELERPAKRLVGLAKVFLQPGQTTQVTVPVTVADLAFFDERDGRFVVDPGRYRLEVGSSSRDIQRTVDLAVTGHLTQRPVVLTARPVAAGDESLGVAHRVIYQRGVVVLPRLTVAMNDDLRYGHRAPHPLPAGVTMSYRSQRASVVVVEADNTLRTAGAGVATMVATVEVGGVSVSTAFVIVVR